MDQFVSGEIIDSKTVDGWHFQSYDRYSDPAVFEEFESLVTLWRSKWKGEDLPAWRDFSFEDFKDWYGWLIVEDVVPGGNGDVVFRLWGTNVAALLQLDATGKRMSEVENDWFDPHEFEIVTNIVENGIIACSNGSLAWRGRQHVDVKTI